LGRSGLRMPGIPSWPGDIQVWDPPARVSGLEPKSGVQSQKQRGVAAGRSVISGGTRNTPKAMGKKRRGKSFSPFAFNCGRCFRRRSKKKKTGERERQEYQKGKGYSLSRFRERGGEHILALIRKSTSV